MHTQKNQVCIFFSNSKTVILSTRERSRDPTLSLLDRPCCDYANMVCLNISVSVDKRVRESFFPWQQYIINKGILMAEEIYVEANAKVFEAIYGKGYISLGGEVALNKIFEKIDLDQKKIVDLGFGLGGASLFLAKKYQSNIIGLEVHSWMADFALNSANSELKNRIKFKIYEPDSFFPLENSSVDFLFCKGVLTNIKDKSNIFSETFRVLSPKGEILLIDWLVPECIGSQSSTLYMGDKSHKETKSSYEKILLENGFRNISFEDCSHEYLAYVKNLDILYKSKEHQEKFSTIINQDLRKMLIQSNLELLKSIESKEQFSYKIRAEK